MTTNKQTVETYLSGFRALDRERILRCLTDDIRWTAFGAYEVQGKAAYSQHITEPGFSSPPTLEVVRMVEEGDTVMAELAGEVRSDDGRLVRMAMAEVFVMRDGLICERRAFVIPLRENDHRSPLEETGDHRAWFVTIGHGGEDGYRRTSEAVRDVAHANDEALRRGGAIMGVAGVPAHVRNHDDAGAQVEAGPFMKSALPVAGFALIRATDLEEAVHLVEKSPCAVAKGVVEVWPLQQRD